MRKKKKTAKHWTEICISKRCVPMYSLFYFFFLIVTDGEIQSTFKCIGLEVHSIYLSSNMTSIRWKVPNIEHTQHKKNRWKSAAKWTQNQFTWNYLWLNLKNHYVYKPNNSVQFSFITMKPHQIELKTVQRVNTRFCRSLSIHHWALHSNPTRWIYWSTFGETSKLVGNDRNGWMKMTINIWRKFWKEHTQIKLDTKFSAAMLRVH